jgi:hypothetical protein
MRFLEKEAIGSILLKPKSWHRYVDVFEVLPHGLTPLRELPGHLNSMDPNINYCTEMEKGQQLSFLDILLNRHLDNSLRYRQIPASNFISPIGS